MIKYPDKHDDLRNNLESIRFKRTAEQLRSKLEGMICDMESHNLSVPMAEGDGMEVLLYNMNCRRSMLKIEEAKAQQRSISYFPSIILQRKCSLHPLLTMYNSKTGVDYVKMYNMFCSIGISICATDHSSKTRAVCSIVKNMYKASPGRKFLIFSSWTTPMVIMKGMLAMEGFRAACFDGSVSIAERNRLLEEAKGDKLDALLINFDAGGKGINMEFSDTVILFDPPYNEPTANQAAYRARRIGQNKKVTCVKFITKDTMEEWIVNLSDTKKERESEWSQRKNTSISDKKRRKQAEMFSQYFKGEKSVCPPNSFFYRPPRNNNKRQVELLNPQQTQGTAGDSSGSGAYDSLAVIEGHAEVIEEDGPTMFDTDDDDLPQVFCMQKRQTRDIVLMSGVDYIDTLRSKGIKWIGRVNKSKPVNKDPHTDPPKHFPPTPNRKSGENITHAIEEITDDMEKLKTIFGKFPHERLMVSKDRKG